MIPLFPAGYPEEIFYNICARFVARAHYPSGLTAIQDLFGTRAGAIVDIPGYLGHFVDALPMNDGCKLFTVDSIIDDHSLLPFYGPFLTPERLERERAYMDGRDSTTTAERRSLIFKHPRSPRYLRYCPLCAQDDRATHGECCWRRVHQIAGVLVCPVHGCPLEVSTVLTRTAGTRYTFTTAEDAVPHGVRPRHHKWSGRSQDVLLKIARDAAWLLEQRRLVAGTAVLDNRYTHLLVERGLMGRGEQIHVQNFLDAFTDRYPPDVVALLGVPLRGPHYGQWPLELLRGNGRLRHPLCHLLVMHALGCTAEDFFALPVERAPFGAQPWPCLNPAGDHQGELRVEDCMVTIIRGHPAGTFRCMCGFTYVRYGPDLSQEDRQRYDMVSSYGPVWEAAFKRRWCDTTIPISSVSRGLGVSRRTADHEAIRLGMPYPRAGSKSTWALKQSSGWHIMSEDERREKYRGLWRQAMADNPDARIKDLSQKLTRVREWLSLNDTEWFEANRPVSRRRSNAKAGEPTVDWLTRDTALAEEVKHAAHRLRNAPGRPERLTVGAISDAIGQQGMLHSQLDRLPETGKALAKVVEKPEEFWPRLISWTAQSFRQEGAIPGRSHLARRARLQSQYMKEGHQVRILIDEVLATFRNDVLDDGLD